jgi:hypothetical protein
MMAQLQAVEDSSSNDVLPLEERHQRPRRVTARVRQLDGTTQRVAEPLGLAEVAWRSALRAALATRAVYDHVET